MITLGEYTNLAKGDGCLGKKGFASYAAAEAGLGGLIQKRIARLHEGQPAPYFCGRCLQWHIGHRRQRGE